MSLPEGPEPAPRPIHPLRDAIAVAGATVAFGLVTLVSVVSLARRALADEVRDGLARLASSAAELVDGDLHASLDDPAQWGGPQYDRAIAPLRKLHRGIPEIAYLYTLRLVDGLPHFVLDTAPPGDNDNDGVEDHSYLLDPYHEADATCYAAFGTASTVVTRGSTVDAWGEFVTAYAPFFDGAGRLEGLVGVDLDLSAYHARMAPVERAGWLGGLGVLGIALAVGVLVFHHQRGARRAIEVSATLAEAIRLARDEAEAASESKSRFLANVSHELRTPMTAIVGFTDLLLEEDGDAEQRRAHAATVRRHADNLLGVINDLLDLSRVEAGHMEIAREEYCAAATIQACVEQFRPRALALGIALSVRWDSRVPAALRGDPERLRQILSNLVCNALKFTPAGSVTVTCRYEARPEPRLVVRVEDTGIGITAKHLGSVFEPFMQADASRSRRFGGTGLGLALCKRLAQALGGDITAESDGQSGSVFTFWVAAGCPSDAATFSADALLGERAAALPRASGATLSGRILLAEDGRDNQILVRRILERAGLSVDVADDGVEAWNELARAEAVGRPYDVLVTDVQMPNLDGLELTRRLRARGSRIPVIALTAHAMAMHRQQCFDAGCTGYATKPIDARLLIGAVEAALAGTAAQAT